MRSSPRMRSGRIASTMALALLVTAAGASAAGAQDPVRQMHEPRAQSQALLRDVPPYADDSPQQPSSAWDADPLGFWNALVTRRCPA